MTNPSKRRDSSDITQLLQAHRAGDDRALERLMPIIYEELHQIASRQIRRDGERHTIDATALVHEAYLKLDQSRNLNAANRNHFYAIVARTMRSYLIDRIRTRSAEKRGGGTPNLYLTHLNNVGIKDDVDFMALDDAIKRLAIKHERPARGVELRFFVGLNHQEVADTLGISESTARADWALAKAWLFRELQG